jgi:MFS family permease
MARTAELPSSEGHQLPTAEEARVPAGSQGHSGSRDAPGARARRSLWDRRLSSYPPPGRRYFYLGITVAATIVLYYQLYIQYAVSTSVISHYGMTFTFFVYISVVANVIGAFASLLAGLADRWGRANLVIYGLLVAGLITAFGLPNAPDKVTYLVLFSALSFVEGMILVATPALVRDFSPQLGRASAMSYWTMGPVIGSIVVTAVVSSTFGGSTTWQDEIRYAGIAGLVMFVVALAFLRELAPALRDQIMVTLRDRALVEARAKGLDTDALLKHQWRQMLRLDVVGPAFGVAVYLLLYYAAVGSFVIYFATVFGYPAQRTNGLLNWYWAADAVALIAAGYLSDRLKVRKPFMLIGAIASIAVTVVFAITARHPHTSYATFALILAAIGIAGGIAYAPWMAGFTETVEKHNPAATATGLAVYGWTVRVVAALSAAFLPLVVSAVTPLVDHGAAVSAAATRAAPALTIIKAHPRLFAELARYPAGHAPPALQAQAVAAVGPHGLLTVKAAGPDLAILQKYGTIVSEASASNPGQWEQWWWICLAGQVVFVPFIFVMTGRWRPRKAARDLAEHEENVTRELASLEAAARQ